MVARTADTQLGHSLLLLAATVLAMVLDLRGPPLAVLAWPLHGDALAAGLGGAAWLAIVAAYRPTVRAYDLGPLWLLTLPVAALLFVAMTADSARSIGAGSAGAGRDAC